MRNVRGLMCLLSLLAMAAPVGTRAATGYFVIGETAADKGSVIVDNKNSGFDLHSSNPLVFNFTSPDYFTGGAYPSGDYLTSGSFALSFSTPVSLQFKKSDFDFYGLPTTYTTFTGTGDNAPMILDLPFADPLGTAVTVSTTNGDQSYYPIEEIEAYVTNVSVEKNFYEPIINNSTVADGARYNGSFSLIDPVNGSLATGSINGTFGYLERNGVLYSGDVSTIVVRDASYVWDIKTSDLGPLPIPEPGQYALMSLGVLAVGVALRHRRRAAMAA